ncbi:hypothetical protein DFH09DRAFT_1502274 [Mycena vulgaris]|nr:hypothetical protein DFH09DRAFT_1502274 [Mycena vulgaris]
MPPPYRPPSPSSSSASSDAGENEQDMTRSSPVPALEHPSDDEAEDESDVPEARTGTRAIRIDSPGIGPAGPATLPRARRAFRAARARAQGCERREEGTGFCESGRDAPRIAGACGRLPLSNVASGFLQTRAVLCSPHVSLHATRAIHALPSRPYVPSILFLIPLALPLYTPSPYTIPYLIALYLMTVGVLVHRERARPFITFPRGYLRPTPSSFASYSARPPAVLVLASCALSFVPRTLGTPPSCPCTIQLAKLSLLCTFLSTQYRSTVTTIYDKPHLEPPRQRDPQIYKDWYRTSAPLLPFISCDWGHWRGLSFFAPLTRYGYVDTRTKAHAVLSMTFGIHGTIEPLAYQVDAIEDEFLFIADGVYYRYSGPYDDVWRYDQDVYADHLDFMWRVADANPEPISTALEIRPGGFVEWWK